MPNIIIPRERMGILVFALFAVGVRGDTYVFGLRALALWVFFAFWRDYAYNVEQYVI